MACIESFLFLFPLRAIALHFFSFSLPLLFISTAMGKKKSNNKKKDDYWDEAFEEDAVAMGASVEPEDDDAFAKNSASFAALAEIEDDDDDG